MPFRKPHQTANPSESNFDGNNKWVIKPKGLNVIWGNDPRYWKMREEFAELTQVSWLEVSGKLKVEKGNRYTVKFQVQVDKDGFGWGTNTDVLVMAKDGKAGNYHYKVVHLDCGTPIITIPNDDDKLEISVENPEGEIHFGLYEVWSGKWKGGLKIYKAEVVKSDKN